VVLSTSVAWPLAPGDDARGGGNKDGERPRDRASAWERAKRELKSHGRPNGPDGEPLPPPEFDQARLDALVDSITRMLPEASNFRHLKDGESVFVTIAGSDENGSPVRMTLKAKKSDIEEASHGRLAPEAFKTRVARRVG
jgi:hypothetical protein